MRRTFAVLSVALVGASQVAAAPLATDTARSDAKPMASSCSIAKARHADKVKVVNACQNDSGSDHTAAYVFAGAAVAGVIAIAVSTTGHHHDTASP